MAKWKTVIALLVLYAAMSLGWEWIWGIVFLIWTIPSIHSGQTFLVEEVSRAQHPVLYWMVVGTWLGLSLSIIIDGMFKSVGGVYGW